MQLTALFQSPPPLRWRLRTQTTKMLRIMKLIIILLTATCLQVSATGSAQTVTLSKKNATLKSIFADIRKQTGYDFFYDDALLKHAKRINIEITNATLPEALEACFITQPLTYVITGTTIVVKPRAIEEHDDGTLPPREIEVHGIITNQEGIPLEGVSVMVKGTAKGSFTNSKGEFRIKDVDENAKLIITSIGYESKIVELNGENSINVELTIAIKGLDQMVVIGYGKTSQRFNIGSVSKITDEEISKQPISNPLSALQGRVPGLDITTTSGLPGAAFNIQIRGQNTINPNPSLLALRDNPLFIIDGVPFAPQNANVNQFVSAAAPGLSGLLNNPYGGISPFNSINPSDIESIEVLRDADATSIYGSRGANGVILITTKKGKAGKTKFNINIYTGTNKIAKKKQLLNTQQYLQMRREAFKNDNRTPSNNPSSSDYAPDLLIFDTTKYTDWQDYFIGGTSSSTDINASISGGSLNTQFLLGTGYHHETYIFPGDFNDKKGSVNLSLSHRSNDNKLSISLSANYVYDINNSSSAPDLLSAYSLPPNYPDLLDDNGNLIWAYKGIQLSGIRIANNPLSYLKKKYNIVQRNLNSNFQIGYNIVSGLTLKASLGYNNLNSSEYSANPLSSNNPTRNIPATANFGTNNYYSWIAEPQAEYVKRFGLSKINFLLGGTFQQNTNSRTQISASGYTNDNLIGSVSGAPNKSASDDFNEYKYNAVFGRLNYIYNERYILNVTGRRDGSSRFGPGKQFGNFGSVGGGWLFSEEQFIKKAVPIISYGKLKASYGSAGSDAIPDYQYIARWLPTNFSYQGSLGYLPQNLFNPEFSWSITKQFQGGLDLGFFKDNIIFNVTWYRKRSSNELVTYPLPYQTGFGGVTENQNALVQNTGWEFQVFSNNFKTRQFNWTTSFNLTVPHNKLLSFPDLENTAYSTTYVIGQSLNVLLKFQYIGVNDTTGVFQFLSANKVPTYTPLLPSGGKLNDYVVIGNRDPKFYGGIRNTFNYKGIELDFFIEFKKQIGMNYWGQVYHSLLPGQQFNQPIEVLSRWQKPGDKTELQSYTTQASTPAGRAARMYFNSSSGAYSDASYIRFKTVSISYNIPNKILKKAKIENCRFYLHAQNLFTITNYKGTDPETQSYYGIPPMRTMTAGMQFNF